MWCRGVVRCRYAVHGIKRRRWRRRQHAGSAHRCHWRRARARSTRQSPFCVLGVGVGVVLISRRGLISITSIHHSNFPPPSLSQPAGSLRSAIAGPRCFSSSFMVSHYGSTRRPVPAMADPIRPSPRTRRRERRVARAAAHAPPGATILSSFSNLANTIIGSGALAFPAAFASMGMIPGIISCLFSASTAIFGLWLLSRCATLVGKNPGDEGRKASFNEVARLAFGKGWVMRLFDVRGGRGCYADHSWRLRSSALACRCRI